MPKVSSVSIVPAGLTKYREGLFHLEPFSTEESRDIIQIVEKYASVCREKHGIYVFYAADELYIKAGLDFPSGDKYDGYPQIENGVGMIRSMSDEFCHMLSDLKGFDVRPRKCSVATGEAAYAFIQSMIDRLTEKCPNLNCTVYPIRNDFFGENITVAGLLTGKDIYHQLRGKDLGSRLFLSSAMLRYDKDMFLDDITPGWLEKKLNVKIEFIDCDGCEFVEKILGIDRENGVER